MTTGTLSSRLWWPWLKHGLTFAFFALVIYLIVVNAREIEWSKVVVSLSKLPTTTLALAALLAVVGHITYSCFDLLGRAYTGHDLSTKKVLGTTFVSYAFNLNLGSIVGGWGFRYRLYSRLGLTDGQITRIIGLGMLTNWFGYLALAGVVFLLRPIDIPSDWAIGSGALQGIGAVLLALAASFYALCAFSSRRKWRIRGHDLELPTFRLATLQLVISMANWMLIGTIVYVLFEQRIDYVSVLAVLLISAFAGVVTHVPAGLGVLEAVFVTLLAGDVPKNDLLGALLAYRAVYYLGPLAVAALTYLAFETLIGGASRKIK